MKWRKVTGGYRASVDGSEWEIRPAWRGSFRPREAHMPVQDGWHVFRDDEWASGPWATVAQAKSQVPND